MRKLFLLFFAMYAVFDKCELWGADIVTVPMVFATGSSLTINSGVQVNVNGLMDFTGATVTNFPTPTVTLTGNVTGSAVPPANLAVTINTIPDLTSEPGRIRFTNSAAGTAPATGFDDVFTDSTDKRLHDKNDAGTTGTTIVSSTGAANSFVSAVSTAGVLTFTVPSIANLTGSLALSQLATQAANTVVGNATGSTAIPTAVAPATARSASLLDIDQKTTVGDANYTILPTDRTVVTSVTFTAARTFTLPAANAVNAGQQLNVLDTFGAANSIFQLTIARAGSDTIEPGALTSLSTQVAGPKQSFTFVSDGISRWYLSAFNPGTIPASGRVIQSSLNTWQPSTYGLPTTIGPADYTITSQGGTLSTFYPTGLSASNISTVSAGYSADTYVAGTGLTIAAGDFKVQGRYHFVFDMTKTAAGTAAPVITVRAGTLGTTGDAAICTLTFSAGTAAADSGVFEGWMNFRIVGGGGIAIFNAVATCVHQGGTTGLVSKNSDYAQNLSVGFSSTTQTKIGVSFNGGASFSGTNTQAMGDLVQP